MRILVFQTPTCNITNVLNALHQLQLDACAATSNMDLEKFDVLIIPGVGNYGYVMSALVDTDFLDIVRHFNERKKRIIGICLGYQLLFSGSDEAPGVAGLGILEGHFELLPTRFETRPPKIGFSETLIETSDGNIIGTHDFYYLHKYALLTTSETYHSIGYSKFNGTRYISYFRKNNVIGCQFHPELSGKVGLKFLKNLIADSD